MNSENPPTPPTYLTGYVGQITLAAFSYIPSNWEICDGQLLYISDYEDLYNVIGTSYGGDGRTSFQLPDLRGRAAMGYLSTVAPLGQQAGSAAVTMNAANLPLHTHPFEHPDYNHNTPAGFEIAVVNQEGTTNYPGFAYPAEYTGTGSSQMYINYNQAYMQGSMAATSGSYKQDLNVATTGGTIQMSNYQPYLGLRYMICTKGPEITFQSQVEEPPTPESY